MTELLCMQIGTLFTLFAVPSLYVLIAQEHRERLASGEATSGGANEGTLAPSLASFV